MTRRGAGQVTGTAQHLRGDRDGRDRGLRREAAGQHPGGACHARPGLPGAPARLPGRRGQASRWAPASGRCSARACSGRRLRPAPHQRRGPGLDRARRRGGALAADSRPVGPGAPGARRHVRGDGVLPGDAGARDGQPLLRRRHPSLRGAVRARPGLAPVGPAPGARRPAGAVPGRAGPLPAPPVTPLPGIPCQITTSRTEACHEPTSFHPPQHQRGRLRRRGGRPGRGRVRDQQCQFPGGRVGLGVRACLSQGRGGLPAASSASGTVSSPAFSRSPSGTPGCTRRSCPAGRAS